MPPRSGKRALRHLARARAVPVAEAPAVPPGSVWRHVPLLAGLLKVAVCLWNLNLIV